MNKGLILGPALWGILLASVVVGSEHIAVVAPAVFHRSLEPWIKFRTEQGWTVHVLVEPFGSEAATTPERIRQRIRLLAEQVPLSALLLVGNGAVRENADPSRIVPSPRIPCRLIQHFGDEKVLASDNWYGDLDDDGLPDIAVGRFAVASPEQLDVVIRKTIRFETEPPSLSRRRLQVVAGVGDFSPMIDAAIESTARHVLTEAVPPEWDLALLHLHWKSPFCPDPLRLRCEILETLGTGSLFWAYIGHGRHRTLHPLPTPEGKIPTLSATDLVDVRSPNGASIALLLCCYGGVPDATTGSLAEEMILEPGGPVAVFAASRTTMPYGMSVLAIELLREVTMTESRPLGTMILAAERRAVLGTNTREQAPLPPRKGPKQRPLRANVESWAKLLDPFPDQLNEQIFEHVALFHLFGDPLLRMPIPKRIELNCPENVQAGSTLFVDGTVEGNGTVLLELVLPAGRLSLNVPERTEFRFDESVRTAFQERYRRSNDRVRVSQTVPLEDGVFRAGLAVPKGLHGEYVVRAYRADTTDSAFGAKTITVKR